MRLLLNASKALILSFFILSQTCLATTFESENKAVLDAISQQNNKSIYEYGQLDDINLSSANPDMYMHILSMQLGQKDEIIYEQLAQDIGVSTSDIRANFTSGKALDSKPAFASVLKKRLDKRFPEVSANVDMLLKQKLEIFATELFVNDNTDDSGFDLITDLRIIEDLLFGATQPLMLEGLFADPGAISGFGVQPPSTGRSPDQRASDSEPSSGLQQPTQPTQAEVVQGEALEVAELDQVVCPIDPDLTQQLRDFNLDQESQEPAPESTEESEEGPPDSNGTQDSQQEGTPATIGFDKYPSLDEECPEDQIFCFKKEKIMSTFGIQIPARVNCIECQFKIMSSELKKLLKNSLIPKKVVGNFGELPYCKEAFSGSLLNFSFTILQKPMKLSDPTQVIKDTSAQSAIPQTYNRESLTVTETPAIKQALKEQQEQIEKLELIVKQANQEYSKFTDQLTDMQKLYGTINSRISLFNKSLASLTAAYKSFYSSLEALSKKGKCK
jgi:hypothetical protein